MGRAQVIANPARPQVRIRARRVHSLTPMAKRKRPKVTAGDAQAFRDAVRDILADQGVFMLADGDTFYSFDGITWTREDLPRPRRARVVVVETNVAA
jgi:hypothetical protein